MMFIDTVVAVLCKIDYILVLKTSVYLHTNKHQPALFTK